ncbi:MAG: hypothetical protein ACREXT_05580 [Gammaproteobacteria bacterium]
MNGRSMHLPLSQFLHRLSRHGLFALLLVLTSWLVGAVAYRKLEGFTWIDATYNAAMILGGMGPADPLKTDAGKLFASFYALYSGVVFLVVAGLVFAPWAHRLLRRFHMESD